MLQSIEAVAFDLDGTLYPDYRFNMKIIPFALKEWRLLSAFGRARRILRARQESDDFTPPEDFYRKQAELTGELLGRPAGETREKINRLMYRGWEPLFKDIPLFPAVLNTLKALKAAGYKLGLLSDFPPLAKLQYMGLSDLWETALCSEDTGALKPHKRPFLELAEKLALPCEKILYVGNSLPYDIAGASRCGMKTAWKKSIFSLPSGRLPVGRKITADFSFTNYRKLHDFVLN